jgi:protein SCO1/2
MRQLAVIALFVILILGTGCVDRPWHGILRSPADQAPSLAVAGAADLPVTRVRLDALRGNVVLLYFGYTHCPDVCPTTLADWGRAKRALGADTTGIRWIFVSVDPTRDSPAEAHGYARQFDPAFIGTAPTDTELAQLLADWSIAAYPEGDPRTPDYTVAHPAHTFVVDAKGRFRLMIPPGVRADDIADDLRRLR